MIAWGHAARSRTPTPDSLSSISDRLHYVRYSTYPISYKEIGDGELAPGRPPLANAAAQEAEPSPPRGRLYLGTLFPAQVIYPLIDLSCRRSRPNITSPMNARRQATDTWACVLGSNEKFPSRLT